MVPSFLLCHPAVFCLVVSLIFSLSWVATWGRGGGACTWTPPGNFLFLFISNSRLCLQNTSNCTYFSLDFQNFLGKGRGGGRGHAHGPLRNFLFFFSLAVPGSVLWISCWICLHEVTAGCLAAVPGYRVVSGGDCDGRLLLLPRSQVLQDHGLLQEPCSPGERKWQEG